MKRMIPVIASLLALAGLVTVMQAAYTYYFTCDQYSCAYSDYTNNGYGFFSNQPVPDGSSDYEIKTVGSDVNIHYLRATSGAGMNTQIGLCYESFYGVIITTTNAYIVKCSYYSLTWLASTTVASTSTTVWRSVISGSTIMVYRNGARVLTAQDSELTSGVPGAQFIYGTYFGALDRVPPNAVNPLSVVSTPFPNSVDLQWGLTTDDTNGTGIVSYEVYRDGQYLGEVPSRTFTDSAVSPGTGYTYSIRARDFHNNLGPNSNVSVTTPANGAADARRIGVRGDGSYWGAAGEQIDMRSGNLNFTLPLVKAEGRGGWGVGFALNYNSQNWRKDNGMWKLGQDVGFGFGWRLLAGSLTPVFSNMVTVHHYIFTDSTGAEYRLGINSGGIWTSSESAYVKYDANQTKLFFPDGSAWEMNCLSGSGEDDAGTRYPTRMEDTSGNYIEIWYQTGKGAVYSNSSARITNIRDVRVTQNPYDTFLFTYNNDATPHLTGITNNIGTAEAYTFSYTTPATLYAPFAPQTAFGTAQMLQTMTRSGVNLTHTFEYGPNGAGELTKVILPFGGDIRWTHADFAYTGGRTYREVVSRQLVKQSGATPTTYPITRPSGDSALYLHSQAVLTDPSGAGQRAWNFNTAGQVTSYEQRQMPGSVVKAKDDYTWVTDSNGRPYIGSVLSTIDPGTAFQKQSKTEQTLDVFGNVTQTKLYGYTSLTTPARTYTNTYLNTGTYPSYHLNNRLLTSVLTDGTNSVTLVSNSYDGSTVQTTPTTPSRWNANHAGPAGRLTQSFSPGTVRNTQYNSAGNVVSRDDGYGHSVSITPSQTAMYNRPATVTANGNSTMAENYTWNTTFLGLTQETGPNGMSATVSYDSYGRTQQTTSPDGAITTYSYTTSPPTSTATTNGRWVKTSYDGLGRPIKVERGDGTSTKSIVETEYDSCACTPIGKTKRVSLPYAPGGTPVWTVNTYDGLGRTISVTAPDGASVTNYSYTGNIVTVTDPAGKWKGYERDAFGNVTTTIEPNPAGLKFFTVFTYNLVNQLTQVQITRGSITQTRSFNYDLSTLRLNSETHPETGTTSYLYNNDGTMLRKTLANGKIVNYNYDAYGRVSVTSGSTPCEYTTFNYDDASRNAIGRLWKVTYSGVTCTSVPYGFNEEYNYTASGHVSQKRLYLSTTTGPSAGVSSTYTFNNEGQKTAMQVERDGASLEINRAYYYDSMGRPSSIVGDQSVSNVTYNAADQVLSMTHGGLAETRQYNTSLQLTRITIAGQMDLEYRYSATQNNGQITSMKNYLNNEEVNYSYDSLGRLASAATTGTEWGLSFSYDGFGNKTAQTVTKGTGPSMSVGVDGNNRVIGHTYDAAGNTTAMSGITSMTWDAYGRMQTVQITAGPTENYVYDPSNQRVWKNGRLFFRDVNGKVLAEYAYDAVGKAFTTPAPRYDYFAGKTVGKKEDRLGTVQTGSRFYPYGEESPATSNDTNKFGTYYRDSASTLDYAINRYYASNLGRFISPDPFRGSASVGRSGSWNRYAYVEGDPMGANDPSGLEARQENCVFVYTRAYNSCTFTYTNDAGDSYTGVGAAFFRSEAVTQAQASSYLQAAVAIALGAVRSESCAALFGTPTTRDGKWSPMSRLRSLYVDGGFSDQAEERYYLNSPYFPYSEVVQFQATFRWRNGSDASPSTNNYLSGNYLGSPDGPGTLVTYIRHSDVELNQGATAFFGNEGGVTDISAQLLHELGHVYYYAGGGPPFGIFSGGSMILPDKPGFFGYGGLDQSRTNTDLIYNNCFPGYRRR